MKVKTIPSSWLRRGGRRFDCNPYLLGGLEARLRLEELEVHKDELQEVTRGGIDGIYHAGREGRTWVLDEDLGVRFLSSSRLMAADYSALPLLSAQQVQSNPAFRIHRGWTLITRSGTIGRMVHARPDMDGLACSEHVMRVVPDTNKIAPGYMYAFLRSKFGVPMVVSGTYGSIIQSIEPRHLADLLVPRFVEAFESRVHGLIEESEQLFSDYQAGIVKATEQFFESVGLSDITAAQWHEPGPDVGFTQTFPRVESFRALNFNPRFKTLCERIRQGPWKPLAEICVQGTLKRGSRFKRIDAEPEHAYQLVGQKQLFWLRPEGRWIARWAVGDEVLVEPGTILMAAIGTLGETELYCRTEFIWGPATKRAYSENIVQVLGDSAVMRRGCLYAFMRSETAFRMLRSISVGTKNQLHHKRLLAQLPVPYPDSAAQKQVHKIMTTAYDARHRGVALEEKAIALVEAAIEEAS